MANIKCQIFQNIKAKKRQNVVWEIGVTFQVSLDFNNGMAIFSVSIRSNCICQHHDLFISIFVENMYKLFTLHNF